MPVIRVFHVGAEKGRDVDVAEMKKAGLHQFVLSDSMRSGGISGGAGGEGGKAVDWVYSREVGPG